MNQQTKQVSATTGHDCGKSTSDELGQNPNCAHGYDIACLICGFGRKNGKRVWHNNKPKKTVASVCTEAEPIELFNSKHCSPRNYSNDSALRVSEIKASVDCSKLALTNFTLSEKNSRLKTNNHALKAALAMSIVVGVVGWML